MLEFVLVLLAILFFLNSGNLLLSLLVLELTSFFLIFMLSPTLVLYAGSDFYVIVLFSLFVIEGVIGVSGLITLVSYTGSDFMNASSVFKC